MIQLNIKTKKKAVVFIATMILLMIMISSMLFYWYGKTIMSVKYSFSEMYGTDFTLEKDEQKNIQSILHTLKIEDSYFFGFSNNTNITIDFYKANALVKTAKLIPGYDIDSLKQNFSFLSSTNIENLDFLNLTYFIELCLNLGIEFDHPKLFSALSKYYDKETNLFFIDNKNNVLNDKIIATSIIKRILGDHLSHELFKPEEGIRKAYTSYDFQSKNDVTFYNSGGDILYCMFVFGMDGEINTEKLNSWFMFWKNYYESKPVDSLMSALQYSEFLNVSQIFDPDYSSVKLQNYYSSLTTEDIENMDDIYMLYNIMKNVKLLNNTSANQAITQYIDKTIQDKELFQSNIDVKATAYGVLLAQKTNYPINEEKLRNFVYQNYSDISSAENTYDRASTLYYNIILDQLINGYDKEYDKAYFQSQVNEILKSLEYGQSLAADVVSTRRMVEIMMDLQIFDVDLQLTHAQRSRILHGMKKALENDLLKNSAIINDIFIVDKALHLDLISDENFVDIYNKLKSNGGAHVSFGDDEIEPDILTTYQFMVLLSRINHYEELNLQKEFIETLKVKDGLYKISKNSDDIYDLTAITDANVIRYLEIGGDKDDSAT